METPDIAGRENADSENTLPNNRPQLSFNLYDINSPLFRITQIRKFLYVGGFNLFFEN
jgi:hypothetical protein